MAIIDEPVRGCIPPPWWWSLPGVDRIHALARGLIPLPPLCRLLGLRPGHVGPASCTWTMPATAWLAGPVGELDLTLFQEAALTGTAMTVVGPGENVAPLTMDMNHFRPIRPANGNLVARCRVINASRFFTYAEGYVEDQNGRQLLHASSHAEIRRVEPPPPPAPTELRPVEDALYSTPDPFLRPVGIELPTVADFETGRASELLTGLAEDGGKTPFAELTGFRAGIDENAATATLPATAWLCLFSDEIAYGAIATIGNAAGTWAALSTSKRGESFVGLAQHTRFLSSVPANGRLLRARTTGPLWDIGSRRIVDYRIDDAEGNRVAAFAGYARFVDAARRQRTAAKPTRRTLCSLLFTDIVGSTQHAERLGDQRWNELLGEQRRKVRIELARYGGAEIDTAGDGFFIRFDSPADALDCAVAAREAVRPLGIEIRAGVHTGECEVTGRSYAGMAVHIGARTMAAAAPGEILTSSTVKDLVMGSGRAFEDRGWHTLKGVPGEWRLYALAVPSDPAGRWEGS